MYFAKSLLAGTANYMVCSTCVCLKVWLRLHLLGNSRWQKIYIAAKSGALHPPIDLRGLSVRDSPKAFHVHRAFVRVYHNAEFLPDMPTDALPEDFEPVHVVAGDVENIVVIAPDYLLHSIPPQALESPSVSRIDDYNIEPHSLPPKWIQKTTLIDLYRMMCEEMKETDNTNVSWRHWLRTWGSWSKTILIRTTRQHKPCSDCERYKEEMRRAVAVHERVQICQGYHKHLAYQFKDRKVAWLLERCSVDYFHGRGYPESNGHTSTCHPTCTVEQLHSNLKV